MAVWDAESPFRRKFRAGPCMAATMHGSNLPAPAGGWSSPDTHPQLCMSRCAFHAAKKILPVFT